MFNIDNIILCILFNFRIIDFFKFIKVQHTLKLIANLIFGCLFNQYEYNFLFIFKQLFHLIFGIILVKIINVKKFYILKIFDPQ